MSKTKATKDPVMRENQPYVDWKKELEIWVFANTTAGVDAPVQATSLFESLEGTARQTVLSELSVAQITAADGIKNITTCLDQFFLGNQKQDAYDTIDSLLKYRRKSNVSMENFIIEFQLKVNKVKVAGTNLSDELLGYALLNAANLSDDDHKLCRATSDELTYKNVKATLGKIYVCLSVENWICQMMKPRKFYLVCCSVLPLTVLVRI